MLNTYEQREMMKYHKLQGDLSGLPLWERLENRRIMAEAMATNPERIADDVDNVLRGNYGCGAYLVALECMSNKRMNRVALLSQIVGAVAWECSRVQSRKAWLSLTKDQQKRIDQLIADVVSDWDDENL